MSGCTSDGKCPACLENKTRVRPVPTKGMVDTLEAMEREMPVVIDLDRFRTAEERLYRGAILAGWRPRKLEDWELDLFMQASIEQTRRSIRAGTYGIRGE